MNSSVEWFFEKPTKWKEAYALLRALVLECGLTETLKWGHPCYTLGNKNIVLIHGFNDYCALLLMKGALLKDKRGLLVQQTPNVQAARQIRFQHAGEVKEKAAITKAYVKEAIRVEKNGLQVPMKTTREYEMPVEFKGALKDMPELKAAFHKLTPGRQRGYLLYFAAPKTAKTRAARIEKYVDKILDGKGLHDS